MGLRKLKYHLINDKACYALFLGAGASVESGAHTGKGIALAILRKLYGPKSESSLEEVFKAEFKMSVSFENVLKALSTGKSQHRTMLLNFFKEMETSDGYKYLAALIKAGYLYPIVITTNFDPMLEKALEEDTFVKRPITVKTLTQEEITSPTIKTKRDEILIIKIHGDLSNPDSMKVLSSETSSLNENAEGLIIRLFEQQGFVMVGYRGKDVGIQNALQRSETSAKGLFWISRSQLNASQNQEIISLLEKHNSKDNIISGLTFDGLFRELGMPLTKVQIREKHGKDLDEAWMLLDRTRSFSSERPDLLRQLDAYSTRILQETDLKEAMALKEFVSYELDRSGEIYRLLQGVQFLEDAVNDYSGYMDEIELAEIEYALLGELLNLFLTGDQIPGSRGDHVDNLINRGMSILERLPRKQTLLRAKCLIALAEALKEKAMITEGPDESAKIYTESLNRCQEAITLLKDTDEPEARYFLGMAYRHAAVAFELEGDICCKNSERKEKYELWRQYSSVAIETLEEVGEDTVRGYALMNLASSHTRLCEFEVSDWKKKELLEKGREHLKKSIELVRGVEDYRGIGWAYIHLCENTRQHINLNVDAKERSILLSKLESYANKAVSELKKVEDHLAQGLAYEQLGIALYQVYKDTDGNMPIKLNKAVAVLQEGIKKLKETGYYRGTGEAFLWLAKCQFELWKQSSEARHLLDAIHSLTQGITSTATGLKSPESLESLYGLLNKELDRIL